MKFILVIMLTFGNADVQKTLLVRGPAYESIKACEAHREEYRIKSELPIYDASSACIRERQT